MKKTLALCVVAAFLGGCSSVNNPLTAKNNKEVKPVQVVDGTVNNEFHLASSHWSDVARIRDEATRLSFQVSQGSMTKVQAAQLLDQFRIAQVGHNMVDDDMYAIYLRSVVESQQGSIDTAQSKAYIQNALSGWQQRWPVMRSKPANPAFTNFLMEVMNMKPLQ
ncbi:prokaryotic membrane lipolipid attachment site family protein [Snodgrassella alvi]|uniref:prokaryotic membrane lipolipid attachment site family protein n=1 Tax=Snodgrassella alvi TaxID=1196083 RepID=UPI000A059CEE|nr:prokaryotic membrane lipolipid attachment site family protein [Snodgrassella alvi]ORF01502.1 prokaryotic membrane lipolipid attachment site family protein [Snodgrassella alvi]ORF08736.1 prokaryotic membrane lipolipid attachment site family protein [Snodgrassella alvi]ORF12884.1 prokaryotic membrane lipolipid attachment site family protein [Snodgrassella alvi]ORF13373.1 prokaryotic membrane lipolipid attachment site family protein [Snodgrassella alvi]ORF19321.1 prokaryotic membrane lipolipid